MSHILKTFGCCFLLDSAVAKTLELSSVTVVSSLINLAMSFPFLDLKLEFFWVGLYIPVIATVHEAEAGGPQG